LFFETIGKLFAAEDISIKEGFSKKEKTLSRDNLGFSLIFEKERDISG
jgi:hypothetical protein